MRYDELCLLQSHQSIVASKRLVKSHSVLRKPTSTAPEQSPATAREYTLPASVYCILFHSFLMRRKSKSCAIVRTTRIICVSPHATPGQHRNTSAMSRTSSSILATCLDAYCDDVCVVSVMLITGSVKMLNCAPYLVPTYTREALEWRFLKVCTVVFKGVSQYGRA